MDNPSLNEAGAEAAYDLGEIKAQLRISGSAEDAPLTAMCDTAVAVLQDRTGRVLISSTWTWVLDAFGPSRDGGADFWFERYPSGNRVRPELRMPILPLVSVETIHYVDGGGVTRLLDSSAYQVDARNGRIAPAVGSSWPQTGTGYLNAITIDFTAGYGTTRGAVPVKLRHALGMLIGHYWENRETTSIMTVKDVPLGFDELIDSYKVWRE